MWFHGTPPSLKTECYMYTVKWWLMKQTQGDQKLLHMHDIFIFQYDEKLHTLCNSQLWFKYSTFFFFSIPKLCSLKLLVCEALDSQITTRSTVNDKTIWTTNSNKYFIIKLNNTSLQDPVHLATVLYTRSSWHLIPDVPTLMFRNIKLTIFI